MAAILKRQLFFSILLSALFCALAAVFVWYFFGRTALPESSTDSTQDMLVVDYAAQQEIEAEMQAAADSGEYTAENPLIILDTYDDFIYEIDCTTGEIVNMLDLKDVMQRMKAAYLPLQYTSVIGAADWCHSNSIEYDETDGSIIVSSNYQSAILKIDWETKEIIWMLSDEDGWSARMSQYLLTPVDGDDDFEYTYNQHAVEILPDLDDDPDTIDIMVFYNGSTRFIQDEELQEQIALGLAVEPELYSRLVHYRINEVTMEVEQIWQYGKEEGSSLYSAIVGDADYLENGNVLGTFDKHTLQDSDIIGSPTIVEVDANGDEVWTAEIFLTTGNGGTATYRNERLSFYGDSEGELNFAS